MNRIPFPYVQATDTSIIQDGYLLKIPRFCSLNFGWNSKCKDFYKKIDMSGRPIVCPYGFVAAGIPTKEIIITGLNIEHCSPRKEISKRISKTDWCPCIPTSQLNNTILHLTSSIDATVTIHENVSEQTKKNRQERELFEDTIHEIRKINNQLKMSSDNFSQWLQEKHIDEKFISDVQLNIYANSDLLSKRLNAFDIIMNPENKANEMDVDFPVFKKMEKVYKCLYSLRHDKNISVKLQGESRAFVKAKDVLELAFYIIVENAFKYSPKNSEVIVKFKETERRLEVVVQNWGLRLEDGEAERLIERGYRGKQSLAFRDIPGTGLVLFVFDKICRDNKVAYKINMGNDNYGINGWVYKPFIVQMIFDNIYYK